MEPSKIFILDDYFVKDDVINDILKKRVEIDPTLPYRNKLNENNMARISLETELAYNFALDVLWILKILKIS